MNLMKLSRHQKKQRQQHNRHFTAMLSWEKHFIARFLNFICEIVFTWPYSFSFSCTYSIMTLIILMMDMMRDPKARVPRW